MNTSAWIRPLPVLLAPLTASCAGTGGETGASGPHPTAEARVTGSIDTTQRVALPETAILRITLADVSRAGAPARLIATQTIAAGGRAPPFALAIPYDPVVTRGAASRADPVLRQVRHEPPVR